ncbi:hypothetical protein BH11PSE3_BH11PSE3_49460 [soil metagenome]
MLRYHIIMIAMGGMALAGMATLHAADAQSGPSTAFAEHACLEYGATPSTPSFDSCVARASKAFDRGEPDLAYTHARVTRDAREACQTYGVSPQTQGYGQCVDKQVDRRLMR